ncbi:MAG TPA: hypothetical protein DEP42_02720 [Ruminococcaceae bacterium]|nr:hypothetical protein [Oscillospiraceae bacterium]
MREIIKHRIEQVRHGKVPNEYRRSRSLLFPNDWRSLPLNTALFENKERNFNKKYSKSDVLSVSGENGIVNQIVFMGRSYAGASVDNYHIVETGDLVYTKSPLKENPYGIIKLNCGNPGIVSTLYAVYHCQKPYTAQYLDQYFSIDCYLNNYLKPLVKRGAKNDMKVNNEDVLRGHIAFPSDAEQLKIIKILAQCDRVITLKQDLLDEKRKQKKWLMQNLLNPDSGVRLSKFKSMSWNNCTMSELGEFSKGYGISNENCLTGKIPCIKYGDIYMSFGTWFDTPVSFTETEIADGSPFISQGTLLFTGSGEDRLEIGKCTVYTGSFPIAVGGDIIIMEPNKNKVDPLFLAYMQYTKELIRQKAELCQGYSIVHIYANDIKKLTVSIPSTLEEQKAIIKTISSADRVITLLEQELAAWKEKKKGLAQLLMTGLVRV